MLEIAGALGYPVILSDSWQGNDACKNWSFVTVLRNLCLNHNNLTAYIPDCLTKLTALQVLDVSNNNLTGRIPDFASSVKLITTPGNPQLKMYKGPYLRPPEKNDTGCFRNEQDVRGERQSTENHRDPRFFGGRNIVISIEVLRQVTDNFSENNILGKGGFGVVYKGELHDKTKIAVKRMEIAAISNKGMNEFQAEIEVLTKVRHRHLVDLLGYCINGNEGFLVYEYMPQETLAKHLFEWNERGYLPLTWKQRISIALDVARGVEYLHRLAQQIFIHRDLKPSNILLGDDMKAKVGDFGLVIHVPNEKYSLETKVAGTFGYLAPEYAGKLGLCMLGVCLALFIELLLRKVLH